MLGYFSFNDSKERPYLSLKAKIVSNGYFMKDHNVDDKLFYFFSIVEFCFKIFSNCHPNPAQNGDSKLWSNIKYNSHAPKSHSVLRGPLRFLRLLYYIKSKVTFDKKVFIRANALQCSAEV